MKKPAPKPELTAAARLAIANAAHTAKRLRADLMAMNVALTVEGNETATERIAHNELMRIMLLHKETAEAINNLHLAIK